MHDASDDRDPVEVLAEEFMSRQRNGESPTIDEYTEQHPELAGQIREVFPLLTMMAEIDSTPPSESLTDRVVGDFRVVRRLGEGGMGVVYEAEQLSLGRRVALKVMNRSTVLDPVSVERFQREARAAARLHHTNIVPVFGIGCDGDTHFIAMQLIDGQGLDRVIDDLQILRGAGERHAHDAPDPRSIADSLLTGRFARRDVTQDTSKTVPGGSPDREIDSAKGVGIRSPGTASPTGSGAVRAAGGSSANLSGSDLHFYHAIAQIGVQASDALAHAHRQGVIHRDIKPSNLILDTWGTVWITDFGLAKLAKGDHLTRTGELLGTLRYLAPETTSGITDHRGDVHGLGLTLYELCALRPARQADNESNSVWHLLERQPPPLRELCPRLPRDLETIIHKMIEIDPQDRYRHAEEVTEDLNRFLRFEPIRARRASLVERSMRWCRRNPIVATLALSLIVMFFAGFAGVFWQWRMALAATLSESAALEEAVTARENEKRMRETSDRRLYAARIALAQSAWESMSVLESLQWLYRCRPQAGRPDLRGWEWHYLARLCRAETVQFSDHTLDTGKGTGGIVLDVAYSPDGRWLASAGGGNLFYKTDGRGVVPGEAIVRDAESGDIRYTLGGHSQVVDGVAFSSDSRRLVTSQVDSILRIWDLESGQLLSMIPDAGRAAFSNNARILASWHSTVDPADPFGQIVLWNANSGERLETLRCFNGRFPTDAAFSPDSSLLCVATRGGDISTQNSGTVEVWDLASCKRLRILDGSVTSINTVVYGMDDQLVTGNFAGQIQIWNPRSGELLRTVDAHRGAIGALSVAADGQGGRILASGGNDRTIRLWNLLGLTPTTTIRGHLDAVTSLAIHPTERRLASGSLDATVRIWNVDRNPRGRHHATPNPNICDIRFQPASKHYATVALGFDVQLHDTFSGAEVGRFDHDEAGVRMWPRADYVFTADARTIAAPMSEARALGLWETSTGKLIRRIEGFRGELFAVAFDTDGRRIATASRESSIDGSRCQLVLWDTATGKAIWRIDDPPECAGSTIKALAFGGRGHLAGVGDHFSGVRLWNAANGELLDRLDGIEDARAVAFNPQRPQLVVADLWGAQVFVWDLEDRKLQWRLHAGDMVASVAFHPDGTRLAANGYDGDVKIWDTENGVELLVLRALGPARTTWGMTPRVVFSADGNLIANTNHNGSINVWDGTPIERTGSPHDP